MQTSFDGVPEPARGLGLVGTLVIMAPCQRGLVLAADGRQTVAGVEHDGKRKLIQPKRTERTVVTVTGHGTFIPAPPSGAVTTDYLRNAPRLLDISAVVCAYLEERNVPVAALDVLELSARCGHALERYQQERPGALNGFTDREVFRVVLAGYEQANSEAVVRTFVVSWNGKQSASMISPNRHFDGDSAFDVLAYGETDFLNQHVYGGVGRQFLTKATIDLLLKPRPVAEVTLDEAVAAAKNIIGAASKATAIVPAPTGIGGPVNVLLLSEESRPRQLS